MHDPNVSGEKSSNTEECKQKEGWTAVVAQLVEPETTVYSDRLSLHYPPISDALTLLRNSLFNKNKQNNFFIVIKST